MMSYSVFVEYHVYTFCTSKSKFIFHLLCTAAGKTALRRCVLYSVGVFFTDATNGFDTKWRNLFLVQVFWLSSATVNLTKVRSQIHKLNSNGKVLLPQQTTRLVVPLLVSVESSCRMYWVINILFSRYTKKRIRLSRFDGWDSRYFGLQVLAGVCFPRDLRTFGCGSSVGFVWATGAAL